MTTATATANRQAVGVQNPQVAQATVVSAINEYSDAKRLEIYKMVTAACTHLYSKGKLQTDKFKALLPIFSDLAKHDPLFMAHLTAWSNKKDSKDLKVLSVYFNALSDADGTPFFKGATKSKPNLRTVSYALLQEMDPHLVLRVLEFAHTRFDVPGIFNDAKHFPTGLNTAMRKYLAYREQNPEMLRGARRAGLTKKIENIYRLTHTSPSDEAVAILNWKQKDGRKVEMEKLPDFEHMTTEQIVDELSKGKIKAIVALSVLPTEKITASVAKALLKNCTGNQAIILYRWFAKNGFLEVKAINDLFKSKVKEATTAVDRIDTLTRDADAKDKAELAVVRSENRKKNANLSSIGKIWLHIDASGSMQNAIEYAKDRSCIIAECVSDPEKNFRWGLFGNKGEILKNPTSFTKEDFHQVLYGVRADRGSTDCIAMYNEARKFGADVDVYVTDQGHNVGTIGLRIEKFHQENPTIPKPKAAVIVDFSATRHAAKVTQLEDALRKVGIPVSIIVPDSLKESALVAQSVNAALKGELSIVEEIMDTKLPELPRWWNSVSTKK